MEKYTYDQLNHIAGELQYQNKQLVERVKQLESYAGGLEVQNLFAYTSSLFKVVEHPEMYDTAFVSACVDDIVEIIRRLHEIMLPKEEPKEQEEK